MLGKVCRIDYRCNDCSKPVHLRDRCHYCDGSPLQRSAGKVGISQRVGSVSARLVRK
ncbi:hypothetical protein [Salmonella phage 7-11]|uniref:Uncharacterized protein n=1 Tax=Salmonella phage 7-11 TaxID=1054968 RepID=G0X583_9CAUD|nr:hypothetical protein SaPh711_gp150 [Salmonella phage 7-11]AEK82065.1 hypothetical protein [Salmonella phage 7-11]